MKEEIKEMRLMIFLDFFDQASASTLFCLRNSGRSLAPTQQVSFVSIGSYKKQLSRNASSWSSVSISFNLVINKGRKS